MLPPNLAARSSKTERRWTKTTPQRSEIQHLPIYKQHVFYMLDGKAIDWCVDLLKTENTSEIPLCISTFLMFMKMVCFVRSLWRVPKRPSSLAIASWSTQRQCRRETKINPYSLWRALKCQHSKSWFLNKSKPETNISTPTNHGFMRFPKKILSKQPTSKARPCSSSVPPVSSPWLQKKDLGTAQTSPQKEQKAKKSKEKPGTP